MTAGLDDFFNKGRTITMSLRDVPGLTRSVIPHLVKHGIKALTIGVNEGNNISCILTCFFSKCTS